MESIGDISARLHRNDGYRKSSGIDSSAGKWHKDNLPDWLTPYVQNVPWAVRFAQLLNEGGAPVLRELIRRLPCVKWRQGIAKPFQYMNTACSKDNWADTIRQMQKSLQIERIAQDVIRRLQAKKEQYRAIYAACWRLNGWVQRHAVTAQEIGRDRFKFFCWLTSSKNLTEKRA